MNQPAPSPAASTGARLSACLRLTGAAIAGDRLPHLVPLLLRLSSSLPRGAGSRRIRRSGAGRRAGALHHRGRLGRDAVLVDAVCGGRRRAGGGGGMKVHAMGHRQTEAGGGGAAGAALDCEVRRRSRGRGGWR